MRIAVPLAGEMGAGIGAVLVQNGHTVLTCLEGRSTATQDRAKAAGLQDVPFADLATADMILSIVPPSVALEIAQRLADAVPPQATPLFIDLNAINPDTARQVEATLPGRVRFADGSIIGAAPKSAEKVPRFYVSGPAANDALALNDHGLDVVALEGGTGAASAIKMCYGALTKGTAALTSAILMAAERQGIGPALHAELADSQPARLASAETFLPTIYAKAYRWVAEMEQIAGFLGKDRAESGMWQSAAAFFETMAEDFEGKREDVGAIDRFLARGKE